MPHVLEVASLKQPKLTTLILQVVAKMNDFSVLIKNRVDQLGLLFAGQELDWWAQWPPEPIAFRPSASLWRMPAQYGPINRRPGLALPGPACPYLAQGQSGHQAPDSHTTTAGQSTSQWLHPVRGLRQGPSFSCTDWNIWSNDQAMHKLTTTDTDPFRLDIWLCKNSLSLYMSDVKRFTLVFHYTCLTSNASL